MVLKVVNVSQHFRVDWEKLKSHVRKIEQLPKVLPGENGWGGWSIQSSTGLYTDGWISGQLAYKMENGVRVIDEELKKLYDVNTLAHDTYTAIASQEMISCVQQAKHLKFVPRRARLAQLDPGHRSTWHYDTKEFSLRLHFVIETNPSAVMRTSSGIKHLQERNVYLFNVNEMHQAINAGNTKRTHLFMDVHGTAALVMHESVEAC